MCCFFLLHGVVLSLASKDARSPFLPLRRATILRIVPSLGSRIIHVRCPAFCVPIITFRLEKPAHVWAAVTSVTPHCVRPYSPLTGHHLKPRAVSLCTSFPMWKASMAPMAMGPSDHSLPFIHRHTPDLLRPFSKHKDDSIVVIDSSEPPDHVHSGKKKRLHFRNRKKKNTNTPNSDRTTP